MQKPKYETRCVERFLDYVKYDTQSSEGSDTYPSTEKQLVLLRKLVAELREIGLEDAAIDEHGTPVGELRDDDSIDRWLRSAGGDYVHASSSCAIGRVLDDDGAVRGYRGLYVCDASAFPSIPDVNPHLPTTMLAERLVARWLDA